MTKAKENGMDERMKLLARKQTEDKDGYILLYQLDQSNGIQQYVTWRCNEETQLDYYWGHYFPNVVDAVHDFDSRK